MADSFAPTVPPHSLEAEKSVLGSLLIDKDAIIKIADLIKVEDFYYEQNARIYQSILDLFHKRSPIDLITLANNLEENEELDKVGGRSYLAELPHVVITSTHVFQYATIVKQKSTLRKLIKSGQTITGLGFEETKEVEELLESAEKSLFNVSQNFIKDKFVHIKDILAQTYERIADLHDAEGKDKYRGTPTGFKSLDKILSGLQQSDLLIVAARPAMGKTAFALNIAQNVAKAGKSVAIISLEMSKEQLVERLFCALLAVDSWKLRGGKLDEEDFARIGTVMDELNNLKLFIDDSVSGSIAELRAKARRLQMEHGLDVLMIDYLQLMSISGVGGSITNRVQEISEISRSLKTLARELSIPIIAMSQLSRAVENRPSKIPQLADLRESGCLTGDTLIQRADTGQRVPIQSMVGEANIPVWALNENFQLEAQLISKVFSSGYKQTYELRTRSGRTIKASGNHPFLTIRGWKAVEELKPGTHVAIPRALPQKLSEGSMKDEELILLAHLIGDGCVLPNQPIHYTSADLENIKVVARTALELFGICPRIVQQKNWWHVYLPSPYRLTHGKHNPITNWFRKLGLEPVRAPLKKLPQALFSASIDQIQRFLHHLWATDGNISWKNLPGRKPAAAIYYSTTSKELAEQVQHLLLRVGIPSTHRVVPQGKHCPSHQIHVQGAIAQRQFCERVGCYGARGQIVPALLEALSEIEPNPNQDIIPKEVWQTWVKPVKDAMGVGWREVCARLNTAYCGSTLLKAGLSRDRMGRLATALQSKPLLKLAESDVYWDELVKITPLGVEEVFDATVPGAHNFIANDFIVHNSIEQDADVVLMLYREDYYEEDTERAGITDVFIRKHRNGPTGRVELMFKKEQMRFYDIDRGHEMAEIPEEAFQA